MPPRLSKRQQREKEEMEALASTLSPQVQKSPTAEEDHQDEESDKEPARAPVKSAFSLLADATPVAEQSEEEDDNPSAGPQKKKSKKKKKKGTASDQPSTPTVTKQAATPTKKSDGGKKGKNQAKKGDDLDRALAELSLKYSDITIPDPSSSRATAPALASALQNLRILLSLQPKFLDADAEMRKFFGSKVISAAEASTSSTPGYQQPRAPLARSVLCKPQNSWPPAAMRDGLSMRPLTAEEINEGTMEGKGKEQSTNLRSISGDKWFTVEHSPSYRWDQAQFIQVVGMLDPNNLFALMRESYWHVDTLLQVAEVYRSQDDYSVSSDFTSRALFAYERSFSGAFNLANGNSRLDFRKVENRSLFLALHRTVLYLERRGTMRTAFEFARLLFALDPWNDPHGALMHLDFLVVKAEQYDWFLEMEEAWDEIRKEIPSLIPLNARPGWRWSKALVLKGLSVKKGGGEKRATEELKQAMIAFPEVLVVLAPLIGVSIPSGAKLPSSITRWNSSNESESALWLLAQLYAHRSISLWKIPETLAWLNSTLPNIIPEIKPNSRIGPATYPSFGSSFANMAVRHAIVSDLKPLTPFVGSILSALGPQEGYDIVPPTGDGVTMYGEQYFETASAETAKKRREGLSGRQRRARGAGRNEMEIDPVQFLEFLEAALTLEVDDPRRNEILTFLQSGNGTPVVRQLENWVRQHADFAEQFPNATAYLRQPAAQRPRPVAEAVARDNNAEAPAPIIGHMPGAFTGDAMEEQEAEQDDEDIDDEQQAPIFPVRIARRLVGMLWAGGAVEEPEESESDEDVAHEHDDP